MKQIHMFGLVLLIIISSNAYAADESINDVMKADQNNDGKVSFEEYKAFHDAELKARFNSKDINQDGVVDTEEKEVAKVKLQEELKAENEAAIEETRQGYEEDRRKRKRHFFKYQ